MHIFHCVSSYIDVVLLINPSANVLVFREFNVHHTNWLTYSCGTDRPVEVSNYLTQMLKVAHVVNMKLVFTD